MRTPAMPTTSMSKAEKMSPMNTDITSRPSRVNSSGPGTTPLLMSRPSSTAMAPEPGMPSASEGMSAPATMALFAVSGAATPSSRPVPNFSGCREARRSSL